MDAILSIAVTISTNRHEISTIRVALPGYDRALDMSIGGIDFGLAGRVRAARLTCTTTAYDPLLLQAVPRAIG
jgi:hypothetical protein